VGRDFARPRPTWAKSSPADSFPAQLQSYGRVLDGLMVAAIFGSALLLSAAASV